MNDVVAIRAVARMSRVLERACAERCDLSMAHYRVLAAVSDGDERASRVAARLALGKPAISASVEALCRRGLLAREESAGDQRVVTLRLTPVGEAALRDAERAMTQRLGAVLAHTPDGPDITAALDRLAIGLDRYATERWTVR